MLKLLNTFSTFYRIKTNKKINYTLISFIQFNNLRIILVFIIWYYYLWTKKYSYLY